ncbi:MAG: leucyl-tRNA synthetase [Candidatus Xenolissoclinum pacificiensis L6]|uniref:Leucine--tRNA ligase n=1 Tax=Candidatus Xenolissoclinum pacificiensis L6 TaxID=1401685 RepID=W2V244_9RICK|nr:MAG: leucyl-tRNA synthetase [Candidatus Xenolissoclinum pacificiensis L6]
MPIRAILFVKDLFYNIISAILKTIMENFKNIDSFYRENVSFSYKQENSMYVLSMFPYPSGQIHVGHLRNYTIGDVIARYYRGQGISVLYPIGWDAFGLPAENAAINSGVHPKKWTKENIHSMKSDLKNLNLSYDWSKEFSTSDEHYCKYEQMIFATLFKQGLVYRKKSEVNWDPIDKTVLANEQVVDGKGWRSGAIIEKKMLEQWFFKITDFAEDLLQGLDTLKDWPEQVRSMQKRWIGKSIGMCIKFPLVNSNTEIEVFTTRPETIFGVTFIAVSKDHPIVQNTNTPNTSIKVHHPINHKIIIPVFIADFVLSSYGCGAVCSVPAHDKRDFDFAQEHNIEINPVIQSETIPYIRSEGIMINSEFLNGMQVLDARSKITEYLLQNNLGKKEINYKIKDWGISRQRYWGNPIPVVYCDECGIVLENRLPVLLPDNIDLSSGQNLSNHPTWKYTSCPNCKKHATRETDTFDTFVESSWYFLYFCNKHNPLAREHIDKTMPVDIYIGGIEHAVMHLLYARFFIRAMSKCNYFSLEEPFKHLITQGMVCHETFQDSSGNWLYPSEAKEKQMLREEVIRGRIEKMSKSKKNVVNLQNSVNEYGSDVLKFFVLSDNPIDKDMEWNEEKLKSTRRFLTKVFNLFISDKNNKNNENNWFYQRIKSIYDNTKNLAFNKAIANIYEITNIAVEKGLNSEMKNCLIRVLELFTPSMAEYIWRVILKNTTELHKMHFINVDPLIVENKNFKIAVQVNGKFKGTITVSENIHESEVIKTVKEKFNQEIKKYVYVPKKIFNIVT